MVKPSIISSSHRLKGRWAQLLKAFFIPAVTVMTAVSIAQIGEFLPPSPANFDLQFHPAQNFSDSTFFHSDPFVGGEGRVMTVNVVSDFKKSHRLIWSSANYRGSIRITVPPINGTTDFAVRDIALYDDWNAPGQLKVYVTGELPAFHVGLPVVIPFIWRNGSFEQQPLQHLLTNPQGNSPTQNNGRLTKVAQDHKGEFITAWIAQGVSSFGEYVFRRFRATSLPPYLEIVGPPRRLDVITTWPNTWVVGWHDVAMNESQNVKLAVWTMPRSSWVDPFGDIKVFNSTLSAPTQGFSDEWPLTSGWANQYPISIAMRSMDGAGKLQNMPSFDRDYAVSYVEQDPFLPTDPTKIMVLGVGMGVTNAPFQVNVDPDQAKGAVGYPQIEAGKDYYEVVWNYLDWSGLVPRSGGTWEVLSQGLTRDLQLVNIGGNGNPGHKCINDAHENEQYIPTVSIASHPKMGVQTTCYSFASIIGPNVWLTPGNIINPDPTSSFSFTQKSRAPGSY